MLQFVYEYLSHILSLNGTQLSEIIIVKLSTPNNIATSKINSECKFLGCKSHLIIWMLRLNLSKAEDNVLTLLKMLLYVFSIIFCSFTCVSYIIVIFSLYKILLLAHWWKYYQTSCFDLLDKCSEYTFLQIDPHEILSWGHE